MKAFDGRENDLEVSNGTACSSRGSISGDNCGASPLMLCFEDSRVIGCDLVSLDDAIEANSECCASGDAEEEPARLSKSSSLLLSFLR